MTHHLTEEQIRVLRLLSNNEFEFKRLTESSPEKIDRWVTQYNDRKIVIEDLQSNGIVIKDLADLKNTKSDKGLYQKAIPILAGWLKKDNLPNHLLASIIGVLIERKESKELVFDTIINLYQKIDKDYVDQWGFKTDLPMVLGNAFVRWTDDEHAEQVFALLDNNSFKDDTFLLASLGNFKIPENITKANNVVTKLKKR